MNYYYYYLISVSMYLPVLDRQLDVVDSHPWLHLLLFELQEDAGHQLLVLVASCSPGRHIYITADRGGVKCRFSIHSTSRE